MRQITIAAATVILAGTMALAQSESATKAAGPTSEPAAAGPGGSTWRISAGAAWQPQTDLTDAGATDSFSLTRVGATVAVRYPVQGASVFLDHGVTYEFDDYDFDGDAPWSDTQLASYTMGINYFLNRQWAIFGGPVMGVAAETGAELSDAWTLGGIAGVRYQTSKDLSIGVGVTMTTGLEEDLLVLPLVLVNWKITDTLSLESARPQPGIRGTAGLELNWAFAPKWVLGVGGAYDLRRFRLKDDGAIPGGVGQNSSFPLYVRLGWEPMRNFAVSLYGGVLLGGELKLVDDDGNTIDTTDYDAAPFIGAGVSYLF